MIVGAGKEDWSVEEIFARDEVPPTSNTLKSASTRTDRGGKGGVLHRCRWVREWPF